MNLFSIDNPPFDSPPTVAVADPPAPAIRGFTLRDYQRADADAIVKAWADGSRGVVCRHSTGLGKSVLLAELAARMSVKGRVLIVVDVGLLASDLYATVTRHTGEAPGSLTGHLKAHWFGSRIVTSTVQSLYAMKGEERRYKAFDPMQFAAVLIDETESAVAPRFMETIRYFLDGNPDLKVVGVTATPFRTDGVGMAELFDFANDASGELNRDILWSVMNGWLVKPKQGFVRCDLDFSTLKLRKNEEDERDYTDDDLTNLMMNQDEQQWRKMCVGMHEAAKGRQAMVFCPASVEAAKAIAGHLCGAAEDDGAARAIYGEQGEKARDLIKAFKRGEFQYAVSVNMLFKGFDYDKAACGFMLRKTRSRRLYEQSLGRLTRPLAGIREGLNAEPDPAKRRDIITASDKPFSVMFDLVGVHADAKDLGVIDILGSKLSDELRERTKQKMIDDEYGESGDEYDTGEEARQARDEMAREAADERQRREDAERRRRAAISVRGNVEIEIVDDMNANGGGQATPVKRGGASFKQVKLLIALGVSPPIACGYSKRQAGAVLDSMMKAGTQPQWSRVNKWEQEQRQTESNFSAEEMGPSHFALGRLKRLGYTGPKPATPSEASQLIRELENGNR